MGIQRFRRTISAPGFVTSGAPDVPLFATVALTAAQIIAMGTTPVALLAAPGAGKAILIDSVLFAMTRTALEGYALNEAEKLDMQQAFAMFTTSAIFTCATAPADAAAAAPSRRAACRD